MIFNISIQRNTFHALWNLRNNEHVGRATAARALDLR